MTSQSSINHILYKKIGKLFYAISASDHTIREEEYHRMNTILRDEWKPIIEDKFLTTIIVTFEKLVNQQANAEKCFQEFVDFKASHKMVFSKQLKSLIIKTVELIASSYASKNKSELIMLAKLNIALKS